MAPRKANTPTLTREQIVSAAIALVDRDGLESLSMRKLAAEMGVGTMSLYYHVPDKSALYDLILDAVMAEVDLAVDDPAAPVEERTKAIAYAMHRALLAHPHAAAIATSRSMRTTTQLRVVERLLQVLGEAGVPEVDAMQAVNAIGQYAIGVTAMYANHLADSEYHDDTREGDFANVNPDDFPNVTRALGHPEHFGGWESDFEAGVSALIKGLVTEKVAR